MIAKITRGTQVGNIAAYLHGPGKANEHIYTDGTGRRRLGGVVIGSNIGAEGVTDAAEWAPELRAARNTRPDITKPIWQCSLRNTVNDRTLSDAEWADAAQTFAEEMGFEDRPWVAVRHGADHIHIVVSRVSEEGEVWHARNDRRQAQTACTKLERLYGLEAAPRRRVQERQSAKAVRAKQRGKVASLAEARAQQVRWRKAAQAQRREAKQRREANFGGNLFGQQPRKRRRAQPSSSEYQRRQRLDRPGTTQDRGRDRD